MELMAIVIFGLFMDDNSEFFATGPDNLAAGTEWKYVGSQPVPEGHVALPCVNEATGEEIVLFVRQ